MDVEALRREHYNATLVGLRRVHPDLAILRVQPDTPIPAYDAGQWVALGVGLWEKPIAGLPPEELPGGDRTALVRRPFSISSSVVTDDGQALRSAEDEDFYEFYVAFPRESLQPPAITARLFALDPGARLWVADAPRGQNTLAPVRPDDDVLFAATGTGEAPHNKMIWELLRRGHRGRIASVMTTRRWLDQGYRAQLEAAARLFPQLRYAALATREAAAGASAGATPGTALGGAAGAGGTPREHLQDLLHDGRLETLAGFALDPSRTHVFLCGNAAMIGAPRLVGEHLEYPASPGMVGLLERERGFNADARRGEVNIHFERY